MTQSRYREVRLLFCPHHKTEYVGRCPNCLKEWNADVKKLRSLSRGGRPRKQKTYGSLATVPEAVK